MTRLTQSGRNNISNKFFSHTFNARQKELDKTMNDLAIEFRSSLYDEPTRKQIQALPKGWLQETSQFWVNAGGYSVTLYLPNKETCRIPYYNTGRYNITDPILIRSVQKWSMATLKLNEDKAKFRSKMHSFLANITTYKKLYELMPDAATILGENFNTPVPCNAMVVTAKEILCLVANERGEEREGCCNGKLVEGK